MPAIGASTTGRVHAQRPEHRARGCGAWVGAAVRVTYCAAAPSGLPKSAGPGCYTSAPSRRARAATSCRDEVPVLRSRWDTWVLTVFSVTNSADAISA